MAFDPSILAKLTVKTRHTPEPAREEHSDEEVHPQARLGLEMVETRPWSWVEENQDHLWGNMDMSLPHTSPYLQKAKLSPRVSMDELVETIRTIGQRMMNWTHLFRSKNAFLRMFIPDVIDIHIGSIQLLGNSWRGINEETKSILNQLAGVACSNSQLSDDSEYSVINISQLKMKIGELIANNEDSLQKNSADLRNIGKEYKKWAESPDIFSERVETANSNFASASSRIMQALKVDSSLRTFSHLGVASGNLWLNQFHFIANIRNYWKFTRTKFISGLLPYCEFVKKVQSKLVKLMLQVNDFADKLLTDPVEKQAVLAKIQKLVKETEELANLDFRAQLHPKYQKIVGRVLGDSAGLVPKHLVRFFQEYHFELPTDNTLCGYHAKCSAAVKTSNRNCYAFIDVKPSLLRYSAT